MSGTGPGRGRPRLRSAVVARGALPATALLVLLAHLGAALVGGGRPTAPSLLLPVVAAALVWACGHALDLGRAATATGAVLALASPLAVVACATPGAGAASLLVAALVAALVASLVAAGAARAATRASRAPSALRSRAPVAVVLALAPLLVLPLAAPSSPVGAGWGAGPGRIDTGAGALLAWTALDPVLPLAGLVAALAALAVPRLRWLGVAALAGPALVAGLGLPQAGLVASLPALALVVAGAVGATARRLSGTPVVRSPGHRATRPGPLAPTRGHRGAVAAVALAAAAAVVVPTWALSLRREPAAATRSAVGATTRWLDQQVPADERVAVDARLYSRIAASGERTTGLVPLAARDGAPVDGRTADWLVSTPAVRAAATPGTWAHQAMAGSRTVRTVGSGARRVELRRLDRSTAADLALVASAATTTSASSALTGPSAAGQPGGSSATSSTATPSTATPSTATPSTATPSTATPSTATSSPATSVQAPSSDVAAGASAAGAPPAPAGGTPSATPGDDAPGPAATPPVAGAAPVQAARELAANPALALSPAARRVLVDGPVDERLVALLAQLTSLHRVSVSALPPAPGGAPDSPRRTAVLDGLDGQPLAAQAAAVQALVEVFEAQDPRYRPRTSLEDAGQHLVLVLPPSG